MVDAVKLNAVPSQTAGAAGLTITTGLGLMVTDLVQVLEQPPWVTVRVRIAEDPLQAVHVID
jgi:hypothetical protein